MFPDYLKTKEKLQKMLHYKMMQTHLTHMGPLADVPISLIFEGNQTVVIREDGSSEETNMEEITAELQVKIEEVENMSHEMVLDKINGVTEEMVGNMKKLFYGQIEKSADEVDNVVSAGGKPFSMDLFFELLEKIHIDFDEAGNPCGLTFVTSPKMFPSIVKIIAQAKADPANDRRYQAIIERKWEEWRVREGNRELVG